MVQIPRRDVSTSGAELSLIENSLLFHLTKYGEENRKSDGVNPRIGSLREQRECILVRGLRKRVEALLQSADKTELGITS
jgi:hypothetical protein